MSLIQMRVIIPVILLFLSCKKEEFPLSQYEFTDTDRLSGDTSILIGNWSWVYTDHYYGWCDNQSNYEQLTPSNVDNKFEIKIYTAGTLQYLKNDSLVSQYRISFQYFDFNSVNACGSNFKQFCIDLDGFQDLNLGGCVSEDSLMCFATGGFLFYEIVGCETYQNWFVKEW